LEPGVDIEIKYTGLRPGEKLYEELLMAEEGLSATQHEKIHIGQPMDIDMNELKMELEKLRFKISGPSSELIEYVKSMVPTYKSMNESMEESAAGVDVKTQQ
jgi:FlaA1/EpsC-like NDP-sugar epimerase